MKLGRRLLRVVWIWDTIPEATWHLRMPWTGTLHALIGSRCNEEIHLIRKDTEPGVCTAAMEWNRARRGDDVTALGESHQNALSFIPPFLMVD